MSQNGLQQFSRRTRTFLDHCTVRGGCCSTSNNTARFSYHRRSSYRPFACTFMLVLHSGIRCYVWLKCFRIARRASCTSPAFAPSCTRRQQWPLVHNTALAPPTGSSAPVYPLESGRPARHRPAGSGPPRSGRGYQETQVPLRRCVWCTKNTTQQRSLRSARLDTRHEGDASRSPPCSLRTGSQDRGPDRRPLKLIIMLRLSTHSHPLQEVTPVRGYQP